MKRRSLIPLSHHLYVPWCIYLQRLRPSEEDYSSDNTWLLFLRHLKYKTVQKVRFLQVSFQHLFLFLSFSIILYLFIGVRLSVSRTTVLHDSFFYFRGRQICVLFDDVQPASFVRPSLLCPPTIPSRMSFSKDRLLIMRSK